MDSRKYFIVSVAIAAIVTGTWLSVRVLSPPPQLQTATRLPAAIDLAEFSLLDQDSNAFTRDGFKGRWDLVFFGFTHCPDICPITLQVLANARQLLAGEGLEELPRIVLVSVDPERDTPEIIGQYVAHFGDDTMGITGDLSEVRKLTDALGVYFEKSPMSEDDGDAYSVDHSAVVIVVNPDGQFHALFGAPHAAENFVRDLPILMSAYKQSILTVENVHIPPPIPGVSMGAAYLTLTNNSDQAISITRVASPQLESVEMHESVLEDGVSRMAKLHEVAIAAQQSVVFEPGAKHLMLRYPADMPKQITLQFFADDALLLSVGTTLED